MSHHSHLSVWSVLRRTESVAPPSPWRNGICALVFLAFLTSCIRAENITIARKAQSDFAIVCAENASPATLNAATELQFFVEKSTGARLPIFSPARRPARAIVIESDSTLAPESFRIEVRGGDLVIQGHDSPGDPRKIDFENPVSTGTLSAVYELLERTVGVRFYWPDELGTIVPRRDTWEIPSDLKIEQAPRFALRRLRYGPGYKDHMEEDASKMWGRRLRLGSTRAYRFYHAWWQILDVADWAKKGHPEYAALVKGERQTWYGKSMEERTQICTSNPDVQALFVNHVRNSKDLMVSISPNDGYGNYCQCATCKSLDSGRTIPDGKQAGQPDLSDRLVAFYNVIAEKSGRVVGGYGYNDSIEPPAKIKPHANVHIAIALNNAYLAGRQGENVRAERIFGGWGKVDPKSTAYDILYTDLKMDHTIAPLGNDVEKRIKLYDDSGLSGAQLYIAPEMELGGADAYVAAKMLWNPKVDTKALRAEYYRDLYGAAGETIARFYDRAAKQWREANAAHIGKKQVLRQHLEVVPELRKLLAEAKGRGGDDARIRERIARLEKALDKMADLRP